MISRNILSTGEKLPVIGLGTWQQFDVHDSDAVNNLNEVLETMHAFGGRLIDCSPMYGRAETVVGVTSQATGLADDFFYASKIWTTGEENGKQQIHNSLKKMQRKKLDLMQIHNLQDWKTHLKTLNSFKEEGVIRYTGITHYTVASHNQLQSIVTSEKIDFVQVNYSIGVPDAENSLLKACLENNVSVIANEPFDKGRLFTITKNISLPEWATEFGITDWAGYFLKYIISHPAITCVIPGTSVPANVKTNMFAGSDPLPDIKTRLKMRRFLEQL
ncbi:aldo/keto reductase [Pollutibacter soli]|uniref:aldo/keto reductase n=1 Tax=Pollutibacter soli TaxID=3034157 RepID=UPI0030139510